MIAEPRTENHVTDRRRDPIFPSLRVATVVHRLEPGVEVLGQVGVHIFVVVLPEGLCWHRRLDVSNFIGASAGREVQTYQFVDLPSDCPSLGPFLPQLDRESSVVVALACGLRTLVLRLGCRRFGVIGPEELGFGGMVVDGRWIRTHRLRNSFLSELGEVFGTQGSYLPSVTPKDGVGRNVVDGKDRTKLAAPFDVDTRVESLEEFRPLNPESGEGNLARGR